LSVDRSFVINKTMFCKQKFSNLLTTAAAFKQWLIVLVAVAFVLAGCSVNPITGQEELMFIPENQDFAIGRKYAPEVEKQMGGRIDNESLQSYVKSVGRKIARVSHMPDIEYHFTALNHDSLNAFALPGGYIFITRGMLQKLQTEAQLAAILGHETVHVVARDTSNMMSKELGLGLLLASVAAADAPGEVLNAAQVATTILNLKYSRNDEREADLGGLRYMVRAGYNPYGMVETMEMLEKQDREKPVEFLSTHPSPENRISYITRRIQSDYFNLSTLRIGRRDYQDGVLQHLND